MLNTFHTKQHVVVQLLCHVQFFATPWTAAHQASMTFTISWSLLKLISIESMMPSNCLILSSPSPPTLNLSRIRIFSNNLHVVDINLFYNLQIQQTFIFPKSNKSPCNPFFTGIWEIQSCYSLVLWNYSHRNLWDLLKTEIWVKGRKPTCFHYTPRYSSLHFQLLAFNLNPSILRVTQA